MTPPPKQIDPGPEPWHAFIVQALGSPHTPLAGELAHVVEAMDEGLIVLDATGRAIFANQVGATQAGFDSPEAMLAATLEEAASRYCFLDADGAPLPVEQAPGSRALLGERQGPVEVRYRLLASGREIWARVTATPFLDESGKVRRVVLVSRDITLQRRAMEANRFLARASALLAESLDPEATLQALVRLSVPALADGCELFVVDDQGKSQLVSLVHRDPAKEALGRQLRDRYPPGDDAATTRVVRTGEPLFIPELADSALEQIATDGEQLRLMLKMGITSLMAVPLRARARSLGTLAMVSTDGSRRFDEEDLALAVELAHRAAVALENARLFQRLQQAEAKSREGTERLRLALEAGRMGTWEWDLRAGRVHFSPETARIHGLGPENFGGTTEAYGRLIHPEDTPAMAAAYRALVESLGETAYRQLYRVPLGDGKLRWVETQGLLVRDEAKQPLRLLGVCADVTEREQAAQAKAAHAAELARSNAELQQFAYVASHDLQEPLRMVSSYTQLLARRFRGQLGPDADEYIGFAVEGVSRMQNLISDLLAYSRVGSQAKPFAPVSCEHVLARVLANLQESIHEAGADLSSSALPEVLGDDIQLEQLLQNLVGNALKFRAPGVPPKVHVSAERRGREWLFSVRDNGIGIDPQYFERIFVIFQRLHGREQYAGTGIGLAICKKVVERHGGTIWVVSSPGNGATFHFTLPAALERDR